jgi:hypothetical protein
MVGPAAAPDDPGPEDVAETNTEPYRQGERERTTPAVDDAQTNSWAQPSDDRIDVASSGTATS